MSSYTITVNREKKTVSADPDTPLLWVLRDLLGLTGTKFGCGTGSCGACTVHYKGKAVPSCMLPLDAVQDGHILTIEGLSEKGDHPVQKSWITQDVPQCGYCQPGQIMAAAALLSENRHPSDRDIDLAMDGHICRCGTYSRIRRAIHLSAEKGKK